MTDTRWISVNERLPESAYSTLVLMASQAQRTGFYALKWYLHVPDGGVPVEPPSPVTHWMDLPEPPAPPKPADPFEVWWDTQENGGMNRFWRAIDGLAIRDGAARLIWNAAKAHYERPLPDFEAWWKRQPTCGTIATIGYHNAKDIWNAAQGKQDG